MKTLVELQKAHNDFALEAIKSDLKNLLESSKKLVVTKDNENDISNRLGAIKKFQKKIDDRRKEIVKPFQDAISSLKKHIDVFLQDAVDVELELTKKFNAFITAQRLEAERIIKDEQEKLRKEAEEALNKLDSESGIDNTELAEKIIKEAEKNMQAVETYTIRTTKVRGEMFNTSQRTTHKAVVVDKIEAILWAVETKNYALLDINTTELNKLAKELKKEGTENGINYFIEQTLVSR